MRSMILPRLAGALLGTALVAGCNSNIVPDFVGAPVLIKLTGQSDISAEVATVAGPYVFTVVDTGGKGVSGINVTFTITGPATLVHTSAVTDQGGSVVASVQFGQTVGTVVITAKADGITAPAVAHTFSFAAPASRIVAVGGQGQQAPRGGPLEEQLVVAVTDQYNNPVPSILVTFQPSAGIVGTPSGRTGVNGRVGTPYTFPATPGVQTITASITLNGIITTVTFTVTGT